MGFFKYFEEISIINHFYMENMYSIAYWQIYNDQDWRHSLMEFLRADLARRRPNQILRHSPTPQTDLLGTFCMTLPIAPNPTSVSCGKSSRSCPGPTRALSIFCFSLSHSLDILSQWWRSTSSNVWNTFNHDCYIVFYCISFTSASVVEVTLLVLSISHRPFDTQEH